MGLNSGNSTSRLLGIPRFYRPSHNLQMRVGLDNRALLSGPLRRCMFCLMSEVCMLLHGEEGAAHASFSVYAPLRMCFPAVLGSRNGFFRDPSREAKSRRID